MVWLVTGQWSREWIVTRQVDVEFSEFHCEIVLTIKRLEAKYEPDRND